MIRVLIADDHMIVREGLKQILAMHGDLEVAGEAANGNDVLRMVREQQWDVLVTDMSMPGRNGLELIKLVKQARPELPVLVLSMYDEDQYAVRTIRAGASGYINKESVSDQLVAAIRKVAAGGVHASPAVTKALFSTLRGYNGARPHEQLSDRELQVFQLIAGGKSVTEIADQLSLSPKTVSTHKSRLMEKMQMSNSAEIIRYAIEHRLVATPESGVDTASSVDGKT
jgi:two-component system, NarL family, invasion response regulator UvrY